MRPTLPLFTAATGTALALTWLLLGNEKEEDPPFALEQNTGIDEAEVSPSELAQPDTSSSDARETAKDFPIPVTATVVKSPDGTALEVGYDADGNPTLPRDQALTLAKAHVAFSHVEADSIRRRAVGWKVRSSFELEIPVDRYLPPNVEITEYDKNDLNAILDRHNSGLAEMAGITVELARDAYADYLGGEKFLCAPAGSGPFEPIGNDGSAYWSDSEFDVAGWSIQFAFRSKDYPVLEDHFGYIRELRNSREAEVQKFFGKLASR